jgi:hypothetical protein
MAKPIHQRPAQDRSALQRQRDAALRRVSRARRATILGAGALTAALAGLVSAVAPGRTLAKPTLTTRATATPGRAASVVARLPPLATPRQLGLQAPDSTPQSSPPAASQAPPAAAQPPPAAAQAPAPSPAPQEAAPTPSPASSSGSGGAVSGGS